MAEISLKNIDVSFQKKKTKTEVLKDFSATFEDGKMNVVIGPSGCGKTTLLRVIAGTLDAEKGGIDFDDVDVTSYSIRDRNVSLVSQNITLYPHLSVFRNIAFPLLHTNASADEIRGRVNEVARLLKIDFLLSRKPKQISLGQAQRVAIARAIIKRPNLYLFDEPFSNLDEQIRSELRIEIKQILESVDATSIFVTHSLKEALSIGDRIYVMDEGRIVDQTTPEKLIESPNQVTKSLVENELKERIVP